MLGSEVFFSVLSLNLSYMSNKNKYEKSISNSLNTMVLLVAVDTNFFKDDSNYT